jgi:predicted nucleic acid-binding protein
MQNLVEVIVDTNVLVAAFRSSLGASFRLLQTLEQRQWRPVISPALALEYESVLKRDVHEPGLTTTDIDDFLEYFFSRARLVQIYFRWRPVLPDPDDDRILEIAVRAGAPIVTFNARDFRSAERFDIRTMTPGEMRAILGGQR